MDNPQGDSQSGTEALAFIGICWESPTRLGHTRTMSQSSAHTTDDPRGLRWILRVGAAVFGLSALWLLITPGFFLELLGLESSLALNWSMWMIAITLVALTGNMAVVSFLGPPAAVVASAVVMLISAGGLGFVTLLIPAPVTWFGVVYALVGFGFSGAYLVGLTRWWRPGR